MTTAAIEHNAYVLARMADCASPDTLESPGAVFLLRVADDVAEALDDEDTDRDDAPHEIADAAVPIYTYDVWRTFVDLAAYQEDPTELGADGSDMEQAAKVCLYMIADRLARALFEEHDEQEPDDEDEAE